MTLTLIKQKKILKYKKNNFFSKVTSYDFTINNVEITVFDTPGLAEGARKDEEHLQEIKEKVTAFDLFIFCTEMDTERFRNDDINTIQKLTEAFGSQLWEHAVVALTFANRVHPPFSKKGMNEQDFFDKRYRMFKKKIQNVVKAVGVPDEVLSFVPFVATGDLSEPRLSGTHNWLIAFWLTTFKRLNNRAKPAFLIANVTRFNCISTSDQEVPRNRLSRRRLPSGGRDHLQRQVQRRSFQGFELNHRDHGNADDNSESEGERRPVTRSLSMVETSAPPNTEPQPNTPGNRQPAPTLDLDETSANELFEMILNEVRPGAFSGMIVEHYFPGTGQIASILVNWLMGIVKKLLRNIYVNEGGSAQEQQEAEVEND